MSGLPGMSEGTFDREQDVYRFRFPGMVITVSRNGGVGFLYSTEKRDNNVSVLCRPAAVVN
jgi:hypothetical protein